MQILYFILLFIGAYFLGSISSAIITCKLLRLPDPRTQGSKNPGATNVLRIGGKKAAALVLLGDGLKGAIPVMIASEMHFSLMAQGFIALAATTGHIFPLFFQFKGGKGVATFFGSLIVWYWPLAVLVLSLWAIIAKLFRYSSLAAILCALSAPLFGLLFMRPVVLIPIFLMSALIIYRHKGNIMRLIKRTETKIGAKNHE